MQIGKGATGNRNSYIDIVGDTTYTDYGLRVIRNNTGANATSELKHRGTGALNFTTQEAAPIVFNTTNSPALTILAGGNVGIGTSSPGSLLHVLTGASTGLTFQNTSSAGIKQYTDSTAANADYIINYYGGGASANGTSLIIQQNGTPRFIVNSAGNVGINTLSPGYKLHVVATSAAAARFVVNNDAAGITALTVTNDVNADFETVIYTSKASIGSSVDIPICFHTNGKTNEKMRLDTSGRLLVGTSTSITALTKTIELHGAGDGASVPAYQIYAYPGTANTSAGHFDFFRSASSTLGTNTLVGIDDRLGQTRFFGADGSTYIEAARIAAEVDGTPGANDMPGRLVFSTTADGAASPTERMRIGQDGLVNINSGKFKVDQYGITNISVTNDANANGFVFDTGDGGAGNRPKFKIRYGTADQILLDGTGNAEKPGGGSWAAISDSRAKENIVDYTSGLDQLKQIQPRSYRYIGNETTYIGLVAQEVEDAMPELVKLGEGKLPDGTEVTDFRTLDQTPLTFALINAVKEMAEQIDLLKAKVTALESQ